MNNNNVTPLQAMSNKMLYYGFGNSLYKDLKEKMETGAAFELPYVRQFGKDLVQAVLFFGFSDNNYFFNRFSMTIFSEGATDPLQQTFYISRSFVRFGFAEGYNLLKGRSVYKRKVGATGKEKPAWLRLNDNDIDVYGNKRFIIYNDDYRYDLFTELSRYPIEELADAITRAKILRLLEQGNQVPVTFNLNGESMPYYVEAMPQVKSLEFYDSLSKKPFIRGEKVS